MIGQSVLGQREGAEFRIERLIGRGGVGLVYLARQSEPARDVVVKVLAPHWEQDPDALARFDREAKRLSVLHHPNIVEMYDYGHAHGRSYLVMEYLRGELLSDFVPRKGRLSLEEFVPIAAQILKGIGHAHSREMMVRDVKPANIMLCDRKGRANFVKILDFGLAKLLRGEKPITEEHVLGTVGYLAPEAIKGEPTDLRVDVYAIGVLFFYMLSGRLPFEDESNTAVFYKTVHEDPPDLRVLLGEEHGVPEGVIGLVESCLAKDPDDRPADADRIVEQLIDVVPASLFRLPRAQGERHRAAATLPHIGNTGMIELVGAARHHDSAELPLDTAATTPPSGSIRTPALVEDTGPTAMMIPEAGQPSRPVAIWIGAGALAAAFVAFVGLMVAADDEASTSVTPASVPASDEAEPPDVGQQLAAIEAHIESGQLEAAEAALDAIRAEVADDASLRARIKRLDTRLLVERLVATAEDLEQQGDGNAAMGAYRDALQADPTHAKARKALARLTEASQPREVENPTDDVQQPGKQRTSGKGNRRRDRRSKDTPANASSEPPPTRSDSPAPPAERERERKDTFLPTKKSGKGNDVFLPTAKTP